MMRWPIALVAIAGCTLSSPKPPLDIHYFSPERAAPQEPRPGDTAARARVRLGRVDQVGHLRYRIVQRASDVEVALYERRRWTEHPDAYVRRSLAHALFDARPLEQAVGGPAPALDVEVLAFEEVLMPAHRGRVTLRYVLHDRRTVIASGEITAERPVRGDGFDAVVVAIAGAMIDAASRVADAVMREVCPPPAQ
jgi:cholesterol transport system auxiliary component